MEVGTITEILDLPPVAAEVGLVSHVHWTMHVTDEVHEEFKRKCLLLLVQLAALERFDLLFHGADYIAFLIDLRIIESLVSVNVLVMPSAGMFVFRRVAGIVHPIRPIHDGFPVENLGNLLVRLFREMLFSNRACDIMTFLSPRIAVDRHGKKTGSNADHLKYVVQIFHVANIVNIKK